MALIVKRLISEFLIIFIRSYLALSLALHEHGVTSTDSAILANSKLGRGTPNPDNVIPAIQFLSDMGFLVFNPPIVTVDPHWISEALGTPAIRLLSRARAHTTRTGEAILSVETKIAREVPLTKPTDETQIVKQLSSLQTEVNRLEKEFVLIQALLQNKSNWPKEEDLDPAAKRLSSTPPLIFTLRRRLAD